MDKMNIGRNECVVNYYARSKNDVLKVVITDSTTEIARSLMYKLLIDSVFGENQLISLSLYELPGKVTFLESVAIELTSCSPNILHDINYGYEASVQFKDADVVFCIGFAREYDFKPTEYDDPFFKEYIRISKFYGEAINGYAKNDAKIIVLGNTAASIISKYTHSIPRKNITAVSLINLNIAAAQIAFRAQCLPTEVKNVIIWGSNGTNSFADCRYMYLTNGKPLSDNLKVWIRDLLPHIMRNISGRPTFIRSIAYALAEHCKLLWHGTPENEWTCMGVLSDQSYVTRFGICFSYPVVCKDKQYEIIKDLDNDRYIRKYISDLNRLVYREVQFAFKLCNLTTNNL